LIFDGFYVSMTPLLITVEKQMILEQDHKPSRSSIVHMFGWTLRSQKLRAWHWG